MQCRKRCYSFCFNIRVLNFRYSEAPSFYIYCPEIRQNWKGSSKIHQLRMSSTEDSQAAAYILDAFLTFETVKMLFLYKITCFLQNILFFKWKPQNSKKHSEGAHCSGFGPAENSPLSDGGKYIHFTNIFYLIMQLKEAAMQSNIWPFFYEILPWKLLASKISWVITIHSVGLAVHISSPIVPLLLHLARKIGRMR